MESGNPGPTRSYRFFRLAAFVLVGFVSLLGQVVFLRETLGLFENSEYILSFFWFVWLAANSAGLAYRRGEKGGPGPLLVLYGLSLAAGYLLLRFSASFLSHGRDLKGLFLSSACCLICLAVPSFLNGRVFLKFSESSGPGREEALPVISLYLTETAGFLAAGIVLLFSFLFLADQQALLLAAMIVTALSLPLPDTSKKTRTAAIVSLVGLTLLLCAFVPLNRAVTKLVYSGYGWKKEISTPYARLTLLESYGERSMIYAGKPLLLEHEPGSDEEILFPALSQAEKPSDILINGAGFTKFLPALLQVGASKTVCLPDVRLGRILTNELDRYGRLPAGLTLVSSPFQKVLKDNPGKFDLVFLDLDRVSRLEDSGLLDRPALELAKSGLREGGIFQVSFPSEGASVSEWTADFLSSVLNGLKEVFTNAQVLLLDNYTLILASDERISGDYYVMAQGLKKTGIKTVYFNEFNTGLRLDSQEGIGISRILKGKEAVSFSDPAAFRNGLTAGLAEYSLGLGFRLGNLFRTFRDHLLLTGASLVVFTFLFIFLLWRKDRTSAATFVTGMTHLGLQIIILYLYQMRSGALYTAVGVLTAVFMAGLASGIAFFMERGSRKVLARGSMLLAGLVVMGLIFLNWSAAALFSLSFLTGLNQGLVFSLMNRDRPGPDKMPLYVSELAGAATASLVIPLMVIPVFGFPFTFGYLFFSFAGLMLAMSRSGS